MSCVARDTEPDSLPLLNCGNRDTRAEQSGHNPPIAIGCIFYYNRTDDILIHCSTFTP